ncbi:MAG: PspA/IM30 family protein [Thermincola sp.]|jgi:phage shock protein A|nr:PspA/IM30 family protein [Thermincola sp.]MDT3702028.1 PspA/IM30 family protein [Thermincola sp.]
MGLFKRISDNIRANLNSLLDKAEDPVIMLDQYLRDMEEDITEAEGAVAKQLALVRKFQVQLKESSDMVAKREAQALEALAKQREDLARKDLEDKRVHKVKADDYQEQYENSNKLAEALKRQLREMKDEYDKLKAKRDALVARAQAAKARKDIHSIMGGLSRNSARRGFEKMEEKVLQMEAEADIADDLKGTKQDLDAELSALSNDEIEAELAELRNKLGEE